ncbi:hypothetical protein LCGC14_2453730, partial [marine sediment metagenome]
MVKTASSKLDKIIRLIPGYDPVSTAGECTFDEKAAQHVIDFFTECLTHVKGDMKGQPFILQPWEQAIVANLFGWKQPDGARRYREAFIFIPRKNGKTTLTAGIVLYTLFCDGEPGAEIYSAAKDREQAALLYEQAKGMVLQEPELSSRSTLYATYKSIVIASEGSSYKAISAEASTKYGYNTHLAIIDELHAQHNRELVDVLMTSTGARRQPLIIHITTSDYERESICNEKHLQASKVRDGITKDPSFLPVIYEATIDDDWADPKVWAKANPNLDVSLPTKYLERECQHAKEVPAYENTFKRLHLNIRTEQATRWISMESWDACDEKIDLADLVGRDCYAGLDLASKIDVASFVLLFPLRGCHQPARLIVAVLVFQGQFRDLPLPQLGERHAVGLPEHGVKIGQDDLPG